MGGFGTILVNAIFRIVTTLFLAHLVWFGVVKKHGCCCVLACCCEGTPNLLATAIVLAIFGVVGVIQVLQSLGSGYALLLVPAFFVFAQAGTQLYLGLEAFMIWRNVASCPAESANVGAPVEVVATRETGESQSRTFAGVTPSAGEAVADVETGDVTTGTKA